MIFYFTTNKGVGKINLPGFSPNTWPFRPPGQCCPGIGWAFGHGIRPPWSFQQTDSGQLCNYLPQKKILILFSLIQIGM
jgi:hypothetical protein